MKLLILLVSVIAVVTAEPPDFPDKPDQAGDTVLGDGLSSSDQERLFLDGSGDQIELPQLSDSEPQAFDKKSDVQGSTDENQIFPEESAFRNSDFDGEQPKDDTDEPQLPISDFSEDENPLTQGEESQLERGLKGSLKMIMKKFGKELQSLEQKLTNSSKQQTLELKSMIANITKTYAGVNASSKFESQLNNLTKLNVELSKKFDSMKTDASKQGCPRGTFWYAPSDQCFMYYPGRTNWAGANSWCRARGMVLAKPYDSVGLRAYIVTRYTYTDWIWLGAQGVGSYTRWTIDGQRIHTSSYLWYSGQTGAKSSSYCLALMAYSGYLKSYYYKPYYMESCTTSNAILCEYIRK